MKTSITTRLAALLVSAAATFGIVESMALLGHPAPDDAMLARTPAAAPAAPVLVDSSFDL